MAQTRCRFCNARLQHTFVDLGMSPLCESYLAPEQLNQMEAFYPLHAYVCETCFLVQLEEFVSAEAIFSEYAYFSSYSATWLEHARRYVEQSIDRFKLNDASLVVEVASNDGYLLQYFLQKRIPVLGIEPAANVARAAIAKGIPTRIEFFGKEAARQLAAEGFQADLLIGNNVIAQVPDLNGFVQGLKVLLNPNGVITLEFPHLLRLMEGTQFDTIYHEHFSYFSFSAIEKIFAAQGVAIFAVEELPTHGGSLRVYGCHADDPNRQIQPSVARLRALETRAGLDQIHTYQDFGKRVQAVKRRLLACLIRLKQEGKTIAGYGAPGKGNTLLNYCGIRTDFLDYTVDRNPYKQGKFLPGTHIPIFPPEKIAETKPDYVLILPWNLKDEITRQLDYIRGWGGRFIIPIPEPEILS